MTKRKMSPTVVMGLLVVIALVGVLIGFFNPGLSY
jgi:mannose/fructose/N-acetylgalactosamine-specific phosphotransferase system component IID